MAVAFLRPRLQIAQALRCLSFIFGHESHQLLNGSSHLCRLATVLGRLGPVGLRAAALGVFRRVSTWDRLLCATAQGESLCFFMAAASGVVILRRGLCVCVCDSVCDGMIMCVMG